MFSVDKIEIVDCRVFIYKVERITATDGGFTVWVNTVKTPKIDINIWRVRKNAINNAHRYQAMGVKEWSASSGLIDSRRHQKYYPKKLQ